MLLPLKHKKKVVILLAALFVLAAPIIVYLNTWHRDKNLNKDAANYVQNIVSSQSSTPKILCENNNVASFLGEGTGTFYNVYYEIAAQDSFAWLEKALEKNEFVGNSAGLTSGFSTEYTNIYKKFLSRNFAALLDVRSYTSGETIPSVYKCDTTDALLKNNYQVPGGKLVLYFGVSYQ